MYHKDSEDNKSIQNNCIELLDKKVILQYLQSTNQNKLAEIRILNTIDSTNNYLLELSKKTQNRIIACFAEQQTHGKGRRGRKWISPFGTNIYHSLLWNFNHDTKQLVGLSLVVAIAITAALKRYGIKQNIMVKWPNDVLWQQKKLAGVLIEILTNSQNNCSVVIGIGVNTHMSNQQADQINQPWTSIYNITQTQVMRNKLAAFLLDELINHISIFSAKGFNAFREKWQTLDYLLGKAVTIHRNDQLIHGIMQGINERGELILLNENNEKQFFVNGDVSVSTI